jgi:small-conductance mechanosensitive channel
MSDLRSYPAMIRDLLPRWNHQVLDIAVPALEVIAVLIVAMLTRAILRGLLRRVGARYHVPAEMMIGLRRVGSFVISVAVLLAMLRIFGVSGTVLWTAFTGFAAVGAVAFFAAWSVLSNIFCTFLILTTRPFRLHDHIELLENGEKPGLKGKVIDINVIYTTLQETDETHGNSVLQIPNSLFFQRTTRRWRESGFDNG